MHKNKLPLDFLDNALKKTADPNRKAHYKTLIERYKEWLQGKTISYFKPPRDRYRFSQTEIVANPEIGLEIDGAPHIIKLFFNKEGISGHRANYIICIMNILWPNYMNAVLDLRSMNLHTFNGIFEEFCSSIQKEITSLGPVFKISTK